MLKIIIREIRIGHVKRIAINRSGEMILGVKITIEMITGGILT